MSDLFDCFLWDLGEGGGKERVEGSQHAFCEGEKTTVEIEDREGRRNDDLSFNVPEGEDANHCCKQ